MFTFSKKAEVTQISLTGARLVVILGALMTSPCDLADISRVLANCGLIDKNYSLDTLRIALSTLKTLGCQISRPCKTNNNKYELLSHPFAIKITDDEVQALKTIYLNFCRDSYKRALIFETLINKIATQVYDENIKSSLLGITSFKKIAKNVLEEIKKQDGKHNIMTIYYASPTNKLNIHTITFGKIFLKNKKLYIEGLDINSGKNQVFNLLRVKQIENIIESNEEYTPTTCTVKYKLKNVNMHEIPIKQVVEEFDNDTAIIVGEFSNDFFAVQHMLSFGSDCTVIEPAHIKESVIEQLMEIRRVYE